MCHLIIPPVLLVGALLLLGCFCSKVSTLIVINDNVGQLHVVVVVIETGGRDLIFQTKARILLQFPLWMGPQNNKS